MKVRIPSKQFLELEGLMEAYRRIRGETFHGTIDRGGVEFSWDAYGNVGIESDVIEEVEK